MSEQLRKYMALPQKGKVMAEYIWIDGMNGVRCKSKVRTWPIPPWLSPSRARCLWRLCLSCPTIPSPKRQAPHGARTGWLLLGRCLADHHSPLLFVQAARPDKRASHNTHLSSARTPSSRLNIAFSRMRAPSLSGDAANSFLHTDTRQASQ